MDRLSRVALIVGSILWAARLLAAGINPTATEWAVTLLLLSPLVIVPLILAVLANETGVSTRTRPRWTPSFHVARWLQLPAAGLLCLAVSIPPTIPAAVLCLPWVLVTLLLALSTSRNLTRGRFDLSDATVCTGLLFLPIGGVWLMLWRMGLRPLEFKEVIVMLTAIHFHFAGLVLPMLAGWSGAVVRGRGAKLTCLAVVLGVPAVAAGITATQLGFSPIIEAVAAGWLSLAGMSVAWLQLRVAWRADCDHWTRGLLTLSSAALIVTMSLSLLYGLRGVHHWAWLDIPWMRAWHGTGNALFACLLGVIGWSRRRVLDEAVEESFD